MDIVMVYAPTKGESTLLLLAVGRGKVDSPSFYDWRKNSMILSEG
jgi:hypothetical protein